MSHTMNLEVELHDTEVLLEVCQRLSLNMKEGKHELFSTTENGLGIFLPGWRYPIVVKTDGVVAYDNYGGRWGDIAELNKLRAFYGLEKARKEARMRGYSVYETFNSLTQEIELRIKVEG